MSAVQLDEDALVAAVDLVGRSGATEFQIGYLHDGVPVAEAGWWAHARYRGARIVVEDFPDPVAAAEALARQLLTGAYCTHCGGETVLSGDGTSPIQCRYRRVGKRWVRGCEGAGRPGARGRRGRRKTASRGGRR